MLLDGDVLKAVKDAALKDYGKYQTLINQTLREVFVDGRRGPQSEALARLENRIAILEGLAARKKTPSA